jgi:hypothetical protein
MSKMKKYAVCFCLLFSVCSFFVFHANASATEKKAEHVNSQESTAASQQPQIDGANKLQTEAVNARTSEQITNEKSIEVINVVGEYIGLESPGVQGSFYLDQEFIQFTPKTTGDINELVSLLPGVQGSEDAIDIDDIREITALPISISGGQPWQTGFFLDGLNINNAADPSSNARTKNSQNDVTGGAQTMNVNSQIVSSIEVFDNNIPAQHGDFSGGVVQAKTRSAFENEETVVQIGYRSNQANWGSYHIILPQDADGVQKRLDFDTSTPTFKKNNYNFLLSKQIDKKHGVLASVSYVDSRFTGISLGQVVDESRKNINALVNYTYRRGWIDRLNLSVVHAPYQSNEYITDVLNSNYSLDGGSNAFLLSLYHGFDAFEVSTSINIAKSDNSRKGPPHLYAWARAKGKDWSRLITTKETEINAAVESEEGGFGALENTQLTQSWRTMLTFNSARWLGATHNVSAGGHLQNRMVERIRPQDQFTYERARLYSTALNATPLNCSGYPLDCVERQLAQALDSLAQALGGAIDFSNPDHVLAYSDNIVVSPQYFFLREVRPQENINETMFKFSAYGTNTIEWKDLQLNLGMRYDHDEFYQNHNIAPRVSAGYDVYGNGNSQLIVGVNRYYSAGKVGDIIRAQQSLPFLQFRPIDNGALQGWLNFSVNGEFKYRFVNLSTPFDDEAVIGWKQATQQFGQFSFKWVKRWKRDQLVRNKRAPLEDDGFKYITFNNDGSGKSDRFSFAWSGQFKGHSFWFNASYAKNIISGESLEDVISDIPVTDLVFYGDDIVSIDTLSTIRSNFGRPVTSNLGWNYRWSEFLSTGVTTRYLGAYDTALQIGYDRNTGALGQSCPGCQSINLTLPAFEKFRYDARRTVALNTTWRVKLANSHSLQIRADVSNLLNSRSYRVVEKFGQSGIEVGRQFWLGVQYTYD